MLSRGTRWVTPPSSAGITSESLAPTGGSTGSDDRADITRPHHFVEAVLADRFEQVVDGANVERGDRLVVVGCDENDDGPV